MSSLTQIFQQFKATEPFPPPSDWLQGRTVYGGLSAALSLHIAMLEAPAQLPALVSAHVSFLSPCSASQTFSAKHLYEGKSLISMAADTVSEDRHILHMVMQFARPRVSKIIHDFTRMPDVGGPHIYPVLVLDHNAPPCAHNFEFRPAGGALPFSGAAIPELIVWARHVDAEGVDATVALIALADCVPPGVSACFDTPALFSTVSWAFDLPNPSTVGDWFLICTFSLKAGNGYSFQSLDVWDESGAQVLTGRQTVAIFI